MSCHAHQIRATSVEKCHGTSTTCHSKIEVYHSKRKTTRQSGSDETVGSRVSSTEGCPEPPRRGSTGSILQRCASWDATAGAGMSVFVYSSTLGAWAMFRAHFPSADRGLAAARHCIIKRQPRLGPRPPRDPKRRTGCGVTTPCSARVVVISPGETEPEKVSTFHGSIPADPHKEPPEKVFNWVRTLDFLEEEGACSGKIRPICFCCCPRHRCFPHRRRKLHQERAATARGSGLPSPPNSPLVYLR